RQRADRVGVERERGAGLVLRAIDEVARGGVHHVRRTQRRERPCRLAGVENVDLLVRERQERASGAERLDEIGAELAGGADDRVARARVGHGMSSMPQRGLRYEEVSSLSSVLRQTSLDFAYRR